MSTLAIMVTTPPFSNLTVTAIDYIKTAINTGIEITGVFFYQEGVTNANKQVSIASDEFQAINHWQELHDKYDLKLHLCYTAAEKRGMNDENSKDLLHDFFIVSGLGELVELTTQADRVVQL